MKDLKLSKTQYANLIREIEKSLKKSLTGGGGDFAAPDTVPYINDIEFWVEDDSFSGGGFFSSIGKAFKNVYSSLKKSGIIDKAKDAALKKGRELGAQAIDSAAKVAEKKAAEKGFDISKVTKEAASRAHEYLHDAEGFAAKKIDEGQKAMEKKAGVSGSGIYRAGDVNGSGLYQAGDVNGSGMYQPGIMRGSGLGSNSGFVRAPVFTPGIPKNAMRVSQTHHLLYG